MMHFPCYESYANNTIQSLVYSDVIVPCMQYLTYIRRRVSGVKGLASQFATLTPCIVVEPQSKHNT